MKLRWPLWISVFSVGGVAVIAGCQLIAGIDDRTVWDGGIVTGDAGDAGVDPCTSPDVPPAPPLSTSSSTDNVVIVAALSKVMLGQTDGGPYYGFNLDKTCTCPSSDSCQRPASQPSACDDPNGVDDYARRIFEQINAIDPNDGGIINEATFNNALKQGFSGVLIQVSGYNGKPDDGEVTVTVYGSQGFDGYPTTHPAFDGGDHWILDPSSSSGQFSTTNAYVAGGTLVASLSFPIVIGSTFTQSVTIELDNGLIRADLQMNGNALVKMTGVLGGRWDPAKFLPSLQDVPDPISAGNYLCGGDATYLILKQFICNNVDVNLSPSEDGQGICNAVSMGAAFEASPAILGKVGSVVDASTPCGPNYTDHCP